jgi:hypothetical protein
MVEQTTTVEESAVVQDNSEAAIAPTFDEVLKFLDNDIRDSKSLNVFKGKKLDEALPQLVKNYVHAQQLTGKRVGQFTEEEIRAYVELPVKPADPDQYLNSLNDVEVELVDKYKQTMYDLGLDSAQAKRFLELQKSAAADTSAAELMQQQAEAAESELHDKFGLNYRKAMDTVKQAAQALGGDELVSKVLEAQVKDPVLIAALYKVGKEMGAGTVVFKDAAKVAFDPSVERSKLLADPDFREAYFKNTHPRHEEAVQKISALYKV